MRSDAPAGLHALVLLLALWAPGCQGSKLTGAQTADYTLPKSGPASGSRSGIPFRLSKPVFAIEDVPKTATTPAKSQFLVEYHSDPSAVYWVNVDPALFHSNTFQLSFVGGGPDADLGIGHGTLASVASAGTDKASGFVEAIGDIATKALAIYVAAEAGDTAGGAVGAAVLGGGVGNAPSPAPFSAPQQAPTESVRVTAPDDVVPDQILASLLEAALAPQRGPIAVYAIGKYLEEMPLREEARRKQLQRVLLENLLDPWLILLTAARTLDAELTKQIEKALCARPRALVGDEPSQAFAAWSARLADLRNDRRHVRRLLYVIPRLITSLSATGLDYQKGLVTLLYDTIVLIERNAVLGGDGLSPGSARARAVAYLDERLFEIVGLKALFQRRAALEGLLDQVAPPKAATGEDLKDRANAFRLALTSLSEIDAAYVNAVELAYDASITLDDVVVISGGASGADGDSRSGYVGPGGNPRRYLRAIRYTGGPLEDRAAWLLRHIGVHLTADAGEFRRPGLTEIFVLVERDETRSFVLPPVPAPLSACVGVLR